MKNTIMNISRNLSGTNDSSSGVLAVKQECFNGNAMNK